MIFLALYLIGLILTARCVFIWLDDKRDLFMCTIVSLMISMIWPILWLGRFVMKGFSNPLKPWSE